MNKIILALLFGGITLFTACMRESSIDYDRSNMRIAFGVHQINIALENTGQSTKGIRISLVESKGLESEAFSIALPEPGHIQVTGGDDAGLMYSGLELAVEDLTKAPGYWENYISNATQQYKNTLWLKRVSHIDWVKLTREVERDIEIARKPFR